ncbi:MAG TPA: PQQ-dependent dehydrogenase, methanol/ethanol family [Candidatus Acidoferrales bacterium]|nr:PQQ-dependent dehydrogenase, methanol/ethanol family [Candidatus Acidoferrales bacterium]
MKLHLTVLVALTAAFLAAPLRAQVTSERIQHALVEPQNWMTYSGTYNGQRYSLLKQVAAGNVSHLAVQWIFQTPVPGKFEATPLVVDGVMYVTGAENHAYAVDARTGRTLWHYQRALPEKLRACCGHVNRGFAMNGDKLYMATLDAHVVALHSKTGNVVWDTEAADYTKGHSFTVAPLAVKDKIIVGVSGGEFGVRGFIDAYDTETGQRAWRFYTVAGPGEPGHESWAGDSWTRGGAPAWVTGTFDPELNLIYWPTGNPSPSNDGSERGGDNLYSNSVVALDADTGKLKWHFQFTPHDLHDWDATEVPMLLDLVIGGQTRKVLAQANRNGFFYVLDRSDGKFILGKRFARQLTWAKGLDANGRPIVLKESDPTEKGVRVCPGAIGATNFMSPSYSTQTGYFYVNAREQCDLFTVERQEYQAGRAYLGSTYYPAANEKDWGALRAIDPRTGEIKWEFKHFSAPWAGTLATAGGLVFAGDIEGNLIAFDARTGKALWHFQTGSAIYASPMTFSVDGRQYVAIAAGNALLTFALPEEPGSSSPASSPAKAPAKKNP